MFARIEYYFDIVSNTIYFFPIMNISHILFYYSTQYFPSFSSVEWGQNWSARLSLFFFFLFIFYGFNSIMNKTLGLFIALIKFCTPPKYILYIKPNINTVHLVLFGCPITTSFMQFFFWRKRLQSSHVVNMELVVMRQPKRNKWTSFIVGIILLCWPVLSTFFWFFSNAF